MHSGTVIVYREHGHLALGAVQKMSAAADTPRIEVIGEDGKKQTLPHDRVLFDSKQPLPSTLPANEIKKHLQRLHEQIRSYARTVNLKELWELLQDEQVEAWSWEELADLVLSSRNNPLATAGVLDALYSQTLYFKEKKAGVFVLRDAKSIEDTLHQQQVEQERAQAQGEFLAWTRARLADPTTTSVSAGADRYLDLLKGLALHGEAYDKKTQALRLMEEIAFRAKGHPWDVAFQLLVALGIWRADEELSLLRYQIPTRFPADVQQAAQETPEFALGEENYTNLTSLFTFTIDDAETTDVDDALSVSEEYGATVIGIHITDVGFFVPPGEIVDQAALARGTSVYLPSGKLSMLPPILSEEKASLVEGSVRPTLSFFVSIDAQGHLQSERICRGVIRIGQRFSYDEADTLLRGEETTSGASALRTLFALSQARKSFRVANGAVIIEGDEVKVKADNGEVTVVVLTNDSPSRSLVSECMILANEMAARYCRDQSLPALYVAQPPPDEAVPATTTFPSQRVYIHAARRLMKPSQIGITPAPHAALGMDVYTQVTSPLRRYQDLQMQHQLKHHLVQGTALFDEEQLQVIAAGAQESSAEAKRCERESTRYWLLRFLEPRKGQIVSGQVVRELNGRSFIELDETLLVVPVSTSPPLPLGTPVQVVIGHVDARKDILSVRLA